MGYTNSGKSTPLNQLTGADALAADALFVTLDPWPGNAAARIPIVISDRWLHQRPAPPLIAAFKATLEEVSAADLLLHVIDASDPNVERQVQRWTKCWRNWVCRQEDNSRQQNRFGFAPWQCRTWPISSGHDNGARFCPAWRHIDKLAEEIQRHMEPMVRFRALLPRKIFGRLNAAYAGNLIPLEFGEDYVRVEGELPGSVAATLAKYYVKE